MVICFCYSDLGLYVISNWSVWTNLIMVTVIAALFLFPAL